MQNKCIVCLYLSISGTKPSHVEWIDINLNLTGNSFSYTSLPSGKSIQLDAGTPSDSE